MIGDGFQQAVQFIHRLVEQDDIGIFHRISKVVKQRSNAFA
jgi:hypothetical protein